MNVKTKIRKNLVNIPGWRTTRKLVIIESDDWGAVSMPSKSVYEKLVNEGIPVDQNYFTKYDSLESEEDLDELFNLLIKYKDKNENHPCITANCVVANPDFKKITEHNLEKYFFEPIYETYKRYPDHKNSLETIKKAVDLNIFRPQLHGREHINPLEWLSVVKSNEIERTIFNYHSILDVKKLSKPTRQMSYLAAFDYNTESEFQGFEEVINDAQDLFKAIFGYKSKTFVAPTGIRSDRMDQFLIKNDIEFHQLAMQWLPIFESTDKIRNRFFGSRNKFNQMYWRRNSTFEPSRSANFDWVSSVLNEMSIAFKWHKPCVINAHRVNFIGSLEKQNRENTLNLLDILLKKIVSIFPDVEFISSDQLGQIMKESDHYFLAIKPGNFYYDFTFKG